MNFCVYLTAYRGNKLPPFYIGSSSTLKIYQGYRGSVGSKLYRRIWKDEIKNHPERFSTKIVAEYQTRLEALAREREFQIKLRVVDSPMYINQSLASKNGFFGRSVFGKNHPRFGVKHTAESRQKMSDSRLGKKIAPRSEETKIKMSQAARSRWADSSQREANSAALKNHTRTKEHCENISKGLIGTKHTAEMKAKISVLHLGRKRSAEAILKTAAAHQGMKRSEETKAKLRAAWLRRKQLKEKPYG